MIATRNRTVIFFCVLLVLLSLGLRLWSAQTELWYDEILTLELTERITEPLGVFTQVHHDNSHYLNTLFFKLLGPDAPYMAYHAVSLVFGTLLLILFGYIGFRRSTALGMILMIIGSFSYYFYLYGWMGRGYAPMLFFGLLSFLSLENYLRDHRALSALLFALWACIALLWHLTYLHFFIGLGLWALVILRSRHSWLQTGVHLLRCFAIPAGALLLLYMVDVRWMELGGFANRPLLVIFRELITTSVGFPLEGIAGTALMIGVLLCAAVLLERLFMSVPSRAFLYAFMIVLVPCIALAVLRPTFVFPRYFFPSMVFLLLLLGEGCAQLFARGGATRLLCIALLTAYSVGSLWTIAPHLLLVHGSHEPALRYITAQMQGDTARVGSAADIHNTRILQFYNRRLPGSYAYVSREDVVESPPEWYLKDKETFSIVNDPSLVVSDTAYCLEEEVPQYAHRWAVYRLCDY